MFYNKGPWLITELKYKGFKTLDREVLLKGRLSTVDLLELISLDHFLLY
jgi:hypothetical protein